MTCMMSYRRERLRELGDYVVCFLCLRQCLFSSLVEACSSGIPGWRV